MHAENERHILPADPDVKNFSYTVVDGEVYYRENSVMTQVELSDTAKGRVTGMVELRQIVNELICNELFTWADVYDTANHDERRAILQQFIKEIRVRKDYEISITLNASFNQVEQLKAVSTYNGAEIFEGISEKGA